MYVMLIGSQDLSIRLKCVLGRKSVSFLDQAVIDLGITPQPGRPHLGPPPHLYLYKGGIGFDFVKTRNLWGDPLYRDQEVVGSSKSDEYFFKPEHPKAKGTLAEFYPWKIRTRGQVIMRWVGLSATRTAPGNPFASLSKLPG